LPGGYAQKRDELASRIIPYLTCGVGGIDICL
jgi:hypothetical protein